MRRIKEGSYGIGWGFPPRFVPGEGVVMVKDEQDIHESMQILFSTLTGERVMRARYGCDLHAAMFENITPDLIATIRNNINEGVKLFEQRVTLDSVEVERVPNTPSAMRVQVVYRIRGSDAAQSIVGELDIGEGRAWRSL